MYSIPTDAQPNQLQVSKAVANMKLIVTSYGLDRGQWNKDYVDKMIHDIAVMRVYGDAQSIQVEVFDSKSTIMYQHVERFTGTNARQVDSAAGLEIPVLPRQLLNSYRMVVAPGARDAYRHRLLLTWSIAENRPLANGSTFASDHVAR
ncbi:MAG: hypothetical protein WCJ56_09845, partial [bacterium]